MKSHTTIAIDGPAASGKSSVSKLVAERLGFVHVDSGATYRAFTWKVLEEGIDPQDTEAVAALTQSVDFKLIVDRPSSRILLDGVDPLPFVKSEGVNASVSFVARVPEVREFLTMKLRALAEEADLVMEGRDIGSVVFPDTRYQIYLDASEEVRNARRSKEGLTDSIAERDRIDSTRKTSPLIISPAAHVLDTSELGLTQVVTEVLAELGRRGLEGLEPQEIDSISNS